MCRDLKLEMKILHKHCATLAPLQKHDKHHQAISLSGKCLPCWFPDGRQGSQGVQGMPFPIFLAYRGKLFVCRVGIIGLSNLAGMYPTKVEWHFLAPWRGWWGCSNLMPKRRLSKILFFIYISASFMGTRRAIVGYRTLNGIHWRHSVWDPQVT